MQEGVNLLSLKLYGESNCPGYLNFLWNNFRAHYIAVRWCTSKWKLGHRWKERGGNNTSFFKQAGNSYIWMLLFFKWFFLWVSQFLIIRHRHRVIVLCVFLLCLLVRNAVCTLVLPICAGMLDTCMSLNVELTVSKIIFYEILIMLGIKFITKTELFTRLWY